MFHFPPALSAHNGMIQPTPSASSRSTKGWKSLLLSSLFTSVLGTLLQAVPAWAGQLMSWRFDRVQNRLEFTTNEAVQPQAQLIPNPTRIVLDLPNTVLGRPRLEEAIGEVVQSIRIGQFNANTTRFVIELAPNYTVNPQQVQIQGLSPTRWVVQLPTPQAIVPPSNTTGTLGNPANPSTSSSGLQAPTQLESWRQTPDGLFLRTGGATPRINLRRSRDRRSLELDVFETALAPNLKDTEISLPDLGIERLEFKQESNNPPQVRINIRLSKNPPTWQASVSNLGGIILIPQGGVRSGSPGSLGSTPQPSAPAPAPATTLSQVQAVDLNVGTNQLLIQTSGSVNYQGEWVSGEYRVRISPAQLAPNVRGPQLGVDSPLLRVRLRQENPQTVMIVAQPAAGVQIDSLQAVNDRLLILSLLGSRAINVPTLPRPSTPNTPTPFPDQPQIPDIRPPRGREVVVIDPGHGGPDPGAVGIGGIQEKRLVMEISQEVARLLEQQGVQVILTRTGDYDLDLAPRVALAERENATIFVSIHANAISLDRPEVNGVETFYASAEGRVLANTILQRILSNISMNNRGVKEANFYVIRRTSMPATLVETGFVTGAQDAPRLADPNFRRQMAAAIAQGILEYLR